MDRHVYKRSAEGGCLQQSVITAVHKTVKGKRKKPCLHVYVERIEIDPLHRKRAKTPLLSLWMEYCPVSSIIMTASHGQTLNLNHARS